MPEDAAVVHSWVSRPYARFWGMQNHSLDAVKDFYTELQDSGHTEACLGFYQGQAVFLLEHYDPRQAAVGKHYAVEQGDRGMHLLVAPADRQLANFTYAVFTVAMDFLFDDTHVRRIVVEPDRRNVKIHRLNRRAGFRHEQVIQIDDKAAYLAFCDRERYEIACKWESNLVAGRSTQPETAVEALQPDTWTRVNRLHLCKAVSELAHERLIEPELKNRDGVWGNYALRAEQTGVEYRFRARILSLQHWFIDPDSMLKFDNNRLEPLDSIKFVIEFSGRLGIDSHMLPTYLEEIASTLYGSAYKDTRPSLSARQLIDAGFQEVEIAMAEGHPCFIANNGRIGFDAIDYRAYAPEAGCPVKLIWLAAHKRRASFSATTDLEYDALLRGEIDPTTRVSFTRKLQQQGLAPQDYLLIPVHPWQWFNKLASIFAADIAARDLVCLGYGDDAYLAQQSIRTFFNISHPHKHYVKTALSILNMGFVRGLSAYYMRTTPAINDWVNDLVQGDAYLREKGFSILREVAAVGYSNPHYDTAAMADGPHRKMLAALWRESPVNLLKPGQTLMTMAALLHSDREGEAVLPALIAASGLSATEWLSRYLDCYLSPLLHCYYRHSLVFMPHGENVILVLENYVPVKAIMKDIGEEVCLLNSDLELPQSVRRIAVAMPEELEILSIFTDVFDCFFRFLVQILVARADYSQEAFWRLVAQCINAYQAANPHLQDKFDRHDLFADEFLLSCLNRLQLSNNRQMVDLADPAKNLKFAGNLTNPIAGYRYGDSVSAPATGS
ncbi:GNAT family N-acetyltransferase [Exilibacterium tricleocarpae]|uniref:GNAT family N-acetyltransferase n=2 Tax=Exilibacterium tricleocarpae TaxID=2591008 RepID=A0A545U602_9GAMM|nr:GNAT family N-acetyltransferase [Exilibacterium tricleocarpae]